MKQIRIYSLAIALFFVLCTIQAEAGLKREVAISGTTMGTFYHIKYISDTQTSKTIWKQKVDTRLKEINKHLSMYDPKSELCVFNQEIPGKPVVISSDFFAVLEEGKKLYQLTDGAWDGTIKPLVDLWGFGTRKTPVILPDPDTIQKALAHIGFDQIQINTPRSITKQKAITLDFGSIAKGYGVDAIVKLFVSSGIHDVLVEIGGELTGSGKNKNGEPWTVGISRPDKTFTSQTLFKIIRLDNQAIATSGNYRNFYEIDGKTYSHIIDPKTGFPVTNNIVSASVISTTCTFADGLATALMVMEVQKGIDLVNTLEKTECLIIQKTGNQLISHASDHFDDLVAQ
ncbi:MAG: FAD:protein FMN transferase [Pseudomonadota bacterium]